MLTRILLFATFVTFVAALLANAGDAKTARRAANPQQREAVLQRVELSNAGFNIVIATPKPGSPISDFRGEPDPNLVYLADGELVYAYTGRLEELFDMGILMAPACTFQVERKDYSPRTPVVVYVIPKGDIPLAPETK